MLETISSHLKCVLETDQVGIQDDLKLVLSPVCRSQNDHKNLDLHDEVILLICY